MLTAVVTGANRGIGLEYCRQLLDKGYRVAALCRRASPELQKLDVRIEEGIDVKNPSSLQTLDERLGELEIDLLIQNAGILKRETLDDLSFEQIDEQFQVNALGPLRVTHALLSRMKPGSKIALMTSRMGSIADNTSGSRYGYRMSKAALNIAGVSLAHDLRERQISVAILHPGFVRTEMTGNRGNLDASEAVQGLIARIEALNLENSGTFWHSNGEVLPW